MKNKKDSKNELAKIKSTCEEYLAGWQRAKADYANFQKETQQKIGELTIFTKTAILSDIIPILDNFNKAIAHVSPEQQKESWVIGIFQIQKQLEGFLSSHGLEKIVTIGEKFDPNLHEAVSKEDVKDKESEIIIREVNSGYKCNGKVIIPAKVVVAE